MLKVFPYKYWSTVATCFVGSIEMAVVGVAMNREKATWALKWNMSLLTIVYSVKLFSYSFSCASVHFVALSWRSSFTSCCRQYSTLLPSLWWFRGASRSVGQPIRPCFAPWRCSSLLFLTRCFSAMICPLGGMLTTSLHPMLKSADFG